MSKWIRRCVLAVVAMAVIVGVAVAVGLQKGDTRAARKVQVAVAAVPFTQDTSAVARGQYLFASRGCTECHGADGAGATMADDGKGTLLAGPNITRGNPRVATYKEVDWVRSIRHGVAPTGRVLRLMPSQDYNRLTDIDLAAIVAYARQLAPQSGRLHGTVELPLPARVIYGFGGIPEAFEKINHALPPSQPVVQAATAEYGAYVVQMCIGCHGPDLQGGKIVGGPPEWPAAARLAPGEGSVMPRYANAAAFIAMLKSGKRADGTAIAVMPFGSLSKLSDGDASALFVYLSSLGRR